MANEYSSFDEIQNDLERIKRNINRGARFDIDEFNQRVDDLKEEYKDTSEDFKEKYGDFVDEINNYSYKIFEIEKKILEQIEEYEKEHEELTKLFEEENAALKSESVVRDEEVNKIISNYLKMKVARSDAAIKIKDAISDLKKENSNLKAKRTKAYKDFDYATSLGLSYTEYKDIVDTLRKKKVMDSILASKGYEKILAIPYKERTKEQKRELAAARKQIKDEVAKAMSENRDMSVLETIHLLYNFEKIVQKQKEPRQIRVPSAKYEKIIDNINYITENEPVKVAGKDQGDYVPNKAPKDMVASQIVENVKEAIENKNEDTKDDEKNSADIKELQEAIDALEKVIKLLGKQRTSDERLDYEGLKRIYNEKTSKLKELIEKRNQRNDQSNITEDDTKAEEEQKDNVLFEDYEPDIMMYASRDMTKEEYIINQFEKNTGIKYNPEIHEIVYNHDASGLASEDDVYSRYQIVERAREKEKSDTKEDQNYELRQIFEDYEPDKIMYESRNMTEDEYIIDQFEKRTGIKFNPEKHKIIYNHDANGMPSDDDVYSRYQIVEKVDTLSNTTVPNNTPEEPIVPDNTPDEPIVPDNIPDEPIVPDNTPDEPIVPDNTPDEPIIPDNTPDEPIVPDNTPDEPIVPDNTPDEPIIPNKTPDKPTIPVLPPRQPIPALPEHIEPEKKPDVPTDTRGLIDKLTIYRDTDSGRLFIRKNAFERYLGEMTNIVEVRINGLRCYEISQKEADYLENNKDNDYSPYIIEYVDFQLSKNKEEVIIFRDLDDNNQLYASLEVLNKFGLTPKGTETEIEGKQCYKITPEDDQEINNKAAQQKDPEVSVRYVDVHLKKIKTETIIIYKAIDDNNQLYASREIHDRFGITPEGEATEIEGKQCYKISPEKDQEIHNKAAQSVDPRIEIEYKNVMIKKITPQQKPIVTAQDILKKVSRDENGEPYDLTIYAANRVEQSRIGVAQAMRKNREHNNLVYNVLGVAATPLMAGAAGIMKGINKAYTLFHPEKVAAYDAISKNLDELSEEELQILCDASTGSDANSYRAYEAIMPLVERKLAKFIDAKKNMPIRVEITALLDDVMKSYDKVEELKAKMNECKNISEMTAIRNEILKVSEGAVKKIRAIQDKRHELDVNLHGDGMHSFEENAKAIKSHQNRRGKLFAKNINLKDSADYADEWTDLCDRLAAALQAGDDISALEAFGNKELYEFENTKTKKTWMGELEDGMAGWKPMPEPLDFSPDPLARYITTIMAEATIISGVIGNIKNVMVNNHINQVRQHNAAEQQRLDGLDQQNIAGSQHNVAMGQQVHQSGRNLEGRAGDYGDGLNSMGHSEIAGRRSAEEYGQQYNPNWSDGTWGSEHRAADQLSHDSADYWSDQLESQHNTLNQQFNSGQISAEQYVEGMGRVISSMHQETIKSMKDVQQMMSDYLKTTNQYSYAPLMDYFNDLINNPGTFDELIQGLVESVKTGTQLQKIVIESYQPVHALIKQFPEEYQLIVTPIICNFVQSGVMNKLNNDAIKQSKSCGSQIISTMEEVSKKRKERNNRKKHKRSSNEQEMADIMQDVATSEDEHTDSRRI